MGWGGNGDGRSSRARTPGKRNVNPSRLDGCHLSSQEGWENRKSEVNKVMKEVRKRGNVRFAWVKAHVDIPGNERAD